MKIVEGEVGQEVIQFLNSLKDFEARNSHLLIGDGRKAFEKICRNNIPIKEIFVSRSLFEIMSEEILASAADVINILPELTFKKIIGPHYHQKIITVAERPPLLSPVEIIFPSIYLCGVSSPENVGTITRSSALLGIKSLAFDAQTVNPWQRRAFRASMGHACSLKFHFLENPLETLLQLKSRSVRVLALENLPNSISMKSFNPKDQNFVLVVGGEDKGITEEVLGLADKILAIKTVANESINVSSATAIALHHLI